MTGTTRGATPDPSRSRSASSASCSGSSATPNDEASHGAAPAAAVVNSSSAATPPEGHQPAGPPGAVPPVVQQPSGNFLRRLQQRFFPWRPLPWWVILVGTVYFFSDVRWRYHESPCSVLGLPTTFTTTSIKRAFRTISLCTHPDRLRSTLKRQPTSSEERVGQTLFNRHTDARDKLVRFLEIKEKRRQLRRERKNKKRKKEKLPPLPDEEDVVMEARCEDLDATNWGELWKAFASYQAVEEIYEATKAFLYSLITFEAGFLTTVALSFWFIFLYRMLKELFSWGVSAGFALPLYIVGATISRPLPTLLRFFSLPFLRVWVFTEELRGLSKQKEEDSKEDNVSPRGSPASKADKKKKKDGEVEQTEMTKVKRSTRHLQAEVDTTIRKRIKVRTTEETVEPEVAGPPGDPATQLESPAISPQQPPMVLVGPDGQPMPQAVIIPRSTLTTMEILRLKADYPNKARLDVATATQFDILLPLTKPIIPLLMLICTGQVWNGIISSIVISQFLRSCVPQLNYETHHLLCLVFGFLHTMLGVSPEQVEAHADKENAVLLLQWNWGFKDMVSILNMVMLGAFVASLSRNGNEPQFCNSFASGMGLRLLTTLPFLTDEETSWIPGTVNGWTQFWEQLQADLNLRFQSVDALLTNAEKDIGDCGGGFYRHITQDEGYAKYFSVTVKAFLLVLPLLSALQWIHRALQGSKVFHKRAARSGTASRRFLRVGTRLTLGLAGLVQVGLLLYFNLNAANGGLLNLWLAFLLGSVFESYLACEDLRGAFRQFVTAIVFIFI
ncbi:unnamed protein product [Amoebophrya sp. A120]|nr:unnamed protein product [Amoebophrya sp. A120]|eukprot:GSA120T00006053001.1